MCRYPTAFPWGKFLENLVLCPKRSQVTLVPSKGYLWHKARKTMSRPQLDLNDRGRAARPGIDCVFAQSSAWTGPPRSDDPVER